MVSTAQDLVTSGHYSTNSIKQRKTELGEAWEALKEKTRERSVTLSDSVEVHQVGRLWVQQCCIVKVTVISLWLTINSFMYVSY